MAGAMNTLDPMIKRRDLDNGIDIWFYERGITTNGTALGQAIKTLEETTELLEGINKGDDREIRDAIGDVYVTLRGVCNVLDIEFLECVDQAYNEIKDRRGTLGCDGIFRKNVEQQHFDFRDA